MPTLPAALLALTISIGVAPAFAAPGLTPDQTWAMLQGGPAHPGVATGAPAPPYRVAWRTGAGVSGHRGAAGPIVFGNQVVAVGREEIVAVDARTGKVSWTVARVPAAPVTPAATANGSLLIYPEGSDAAAAVVGLDLVTHAVRWRFQTDGTVRGAPTVDGETVYVGTRVGTVYALDVSNGTPRWTFAAGGAVRAPISASGDLVYVVSEDAEAAVSTVHALRAVDGTEAWHVAPRGSGVFASGSAVADGRLYVGLGDNSIHAFDAKQGRALWTTPVMVRGGFGSSTMPAILGHDLAVVATTGSVVRLDGRTGRRLWRFPFPSIFIDAAPLVVGNVILAGRHDGLLVGLDADSGRLVSEIDLGAGPIGSLAPAGDLLVAGVLAADGGLVGLEHDPSRGLTSIESSTTLHAGAAVLNFAYAFAAALAGFLLVFRVAGRVRPPSTPEPLPPPHGVGAAEGFR